jgi:hypothetical protein
MCLCIVFSNDLFICERSHSAGPRELSIPILLDAPHLLYQAARPESGPEGRETVWMAPRALRLSERRYRPALANGFRVLW